MAIVDTLLPTYTKPNRLLKFKKRFDIYHDNIKPYALQKLTSVYQKANDLKLNHQLDTTNNVYKKIVQHISGVYSNGVKREFTDKNLEALYDELKITKLMKQSNYYLNAFNDLLIHVGWCEDENKPIIKFRYPHNTKVEYENGKIKEVEYLVEDNDEEEKWAFYSNAEHYYKVKIKSSEDDFKKEPIEGNEEMINPFGEMPFVALHNGWRDESFWDEFTGDDLVDITLDTAIYLTFKNHQIKWNSIKLIAMMGVNPEDVNGQVLDGSAPLVVNNQGASVSVLDIQANIKELLGVIQDSANSVAMNYGISPSAFRMTGNVQSGFSKMLDNIEVDNIILEQQSDYIGYEKEMARIISVVSGYYGVNYNPEVAITFPTIYYPKSDKEKLDEYQVSIELGLESPIEIIAKERDIDVAEAEIIYNANIEARNRSNNKINPSPITTNIPLVQQ